MNRPPPALYPGIRAEQLALPEREQTALKILAALEVHGAAEYGALRNSRVGNRLCQHVRDVLAELVEGGYVVKTRRGKPTAATRTGTNSWGTRTFYERGKGLPRWLDADLYSRLVEQRRAIKPRMKQVTRGGRW